MITRRLRIGGKRGHYRPQSLNPVLMKSRPQLTHRRVNRLQQRAFHAHRVVKARLPWLRHVQVINEIYAADEGNPAVDHGELSVQPTQPAAPKRIPPSFWAKDGDLDAVLPHRFTEITQKAGRSKSVMHHTHGHATKHSALHRRSNTSTCFVVSQYVSFKTHFAQRSVNGCL